MIPDIYEIINHATAGLALLILGHHLIGALVEKWKHE